MAYWRAERRFDRLIFRAFLMTIAQSVLDGSEEVLESIASSPLKLRPDNFVARPWGGFKLHRYKGLETAEGAMDPVRLGEAFEIAACDADAEARAYPSIVRFDDGSQLALPELLQRHAARLLGPGLAEAYGGAFPLLPKTLDVKELLSVQGHPEGHTEVYVIIDTDPGATIHVGFSRDIDREALIAKLEGGRADQQRLLDMLGSDCTAEHLQSLVAPWFADRHDHAAALPANLVAAFDPAQRGAATALLVGLKNLYHEVLGAMNAIEVVPGMVVHNANPPRIVAESGRSPSAEVHALGNPEGREILALEIRRPGPTFRAWDNVRFPLREIDVRAAIESLNPLAVDPAELIVTPRPLPERTGVFVSAQGDGYALEHLRPRGGEHVAVPADGAHTLHCIAGSVELRDATGRALAVLARGESALVPVGVGAYRVADIGNTASEVIRVRLEGFR